MSIEIYNNGDKVVLSTPHGQDYVLEAETARQMGEALAKSAYTAKYGKQPESRSLISDQVRTTLITRITHIIRNLTDKKILPGRIAVEVVDTVLAEV